jgi:hypothetical protein
VPYGFNALMISRVSDRKDFLHRVALRSPLTDAVTEAHVGSRIICFMLFFPLPALTLAVGSACLLAGALPQQVKNAESSEIRLWKHLAFSQIESGSVLGKADPVEGIEGKGIAFDGRSIFKIPESAQATHGKSGFTVMMWVNPLALGRGQQMLVAKNRYSLNQREWGVMIDSDDRFRAYIRQDGWKTLEAANIEIDPGRWYRIAISCDSKVMKFYVNGTLQDQIELERPLPQTEASVTLAGVDDNGRIWQTFWGALDEVSFFAGAKSATEIKDDYEPTTKTLELPPGAKRQVLWDSNAEVPDAENLDRIGHLTFRVIKSYEPDVDGYRFLHGVAIAFHRGKLFASFGHNRGAENTGSEEARYRVSGDLGKTWSEVRTIDVGNDELAVSHGVFHSEGDRLWAFQGAFKNFRQDVHTRAYLFDDATQTWQFQAVICREGFWPMQQPLKMKNGNWIMAGLRVGSGNPAAVAISDGNDLLKWRVITIPASIPGNMWGESTVIVQGSQILNIARYGDQARALVATSGDFGESWSTSTVSNLPMVTSKPYAGTLSTGQNYLIATTTADSGKRRSPLTLALTEPGKFTFSRVYEIRSALFDEGPGESHASAALAYPYAIESNGNLYIAFSNNGGGMGRPSDPKQRANNNSAELVIVPVKQLQ